jgi:type III restriction enzyme
MPDAPQIQFPRMESRLAPAPFSLAAIADASARKAGTNFVTEINVPIFRTAIKATRQGEDVALSEHQEENAEAQATLIGLDIVHATMVHAIMSFPEVEQTVTQRNGAKRLVDAFLVGAGASDTTVAAEWGTKRQELAINGLRTVIREAIRHRPKAAETYFKAFDFPIEPEHVLPNAPDTSGGYRLKTPIVGWNKNLMPSASFDAKTTEWALARILDTDPLIRWWGRVRNPGDILIRMETGGNYYPDFIAIDKDGTRWVIEGKSDKDATSAEVLAKKEAAERWARAVRDENDPRYGMWRYMFVTESHLRSANTFAMLLTVTTPE